jgi:hypothetical protein
MFDLLENLHNLAEKLDEVHNRPDLAETLDKIASEIVAKYRFRIKRPRKSRGTNRTKRKLYYKMHRQRLRTRMHRYRMLHKVPLKRRKRLRHYHRFG